MFARATLHGSVLNRGKRRASNSGPKDREATMKDLTGCSDIAKVLKKWSPRRGEASVGRQENMFVIQY